MPGGYPGLSLIADAPTQKVVKSLFDLVAQLQSRVATLEASTVKNTAALDANGQRIQDVADPTADTDAVTRGYLRNYVAAQIKGVAP